MRKIIYPLNRYVHHVETYIRNVYFLEDNVWHMDFLLFYYSCYLKKQYPMKIVWDHSINMATYLHALDMSDLHKFLLIFCCDNFWLNSVENHCVIYFSKANHCRPSWSATNYSFYPVIIVHNNNQSNVCSHFSWENYLGVGLLGDMVTDCLLKTLPNVFQNDYTIFHSFQECSRGPGAFQAVSFSSFSQSKRLLGTSWF